MIDTDDDKRRELEMNPGETRRESKEPSLFFFFSFLKSLDPTERPSLTPLYLRSPLSKGPTGGLMGSGSA